MATKNIVIENARIGFRNFSGEEGKFNPKGNKNFCVFLDTELASILENDGWNVRWLKPRDEEDDEQGYMQVAVNFQNIPPNIVLVSSKGQTRMNEDTVNILDWAEIDKVDLIIRPYNWEVNGKKGVKAYIKSMYVTIKEDELMLKYNDVPDSAQQAMEEGVEEY